MSFRRAHRLAPAILVIITLASCKGGTTVAGGGATTGATATAKPGAPTYTTAASFEIGPICVHQDMPYSDYICPDSIASHLFRPSDVTADTLVVHTSDGRTIRLAMPSRVDAIFLSKSALETFLLRHYDATNPAKAANLRTFIAGHYH